MQFHFLTNCIQPTLFLHFACSFSSSSSSASSSSSLTSSSSSLTSSSSSLWSSSPPQRRPLRRDQWMSEKEVPSFSVTVISFHSSTLFVFLLLIAVVVLFLFMCYIYILSLVFYDWHTGKSVHWQMLTWHNALKLLMSDVQFQCTVMCFDQWGRVLMSTVHRDMFWLESRQIKTSMV